MGMKSGYSVTTISALQLTPENRNKQTTHTINRSCIGVIYGRPGRIPGYFALKRYQYKMVWEPKQCCCGASVRIGTLILGWLALIGNALHVLSLLQFTAVRREDVVEWCRNISSSDPDDGIHIDDEVCALGGNIAISVIAVLGVLCGLGVIISILLLIGVDKKKHLLMLPYLISQGISLVSIGLIGVISIILLAYYGFALGAFIVLLSYGVIMFLEVYFFLVVRACYMEVKQHNKGMGADSNIAYVEQRDAIYNYKI